LCRVPEYSLSEVQGVQSEMPREMQLLPGAHIDSDVLSIQRGAVQLAHADRRADARAEIREPVSRPLRCVHTVRGGVQRGGQRVAIPTLQRDHRRRALDFAVLEVESAARVLLVLWEAAVQQPHQHGRVLLVRALRLHPTRVGSDVAANPHADPLDHRPYARLINARLINASRLDHIDSDVLADKRGAV